MRHSADSDQPTCSPHNARRPTLDLFPPSLFPSLALSDTALAGRLSPSFHSLSLSLRFRLGARRLSTTFIPGFIFQFPPFLSQNFSLFLFDTNIGALRLSPSF